MTRLIALALATLLFVTGCSSGTTTTASPENTSAAASSTAAATSATAAGPKITISDMQFGPPLTVTPGATVTVINSDGPEHSVTADSGNAFNVDVDGKGTATFTAPTQPGTYAYHCTYHPMMHGQLIVQ